MPIVPKLFGHITEAQGVIIRTAVKEMIEEKLVVEIGCYRGRTSAVIASALRGMNAGPLYCIDPYVDYAEPLAHEGVFHVSDYDRVRFLTNMARMNAFPRVHLVPFPATQVVICSSPLVQAC